MHDPSNHAREAARRLAALWREANSSMGQGGGIILLDGLFVGWLAELPPAAEWAPGCLAVAEDSRVLLVRPAGFRGEVEWFSLGFPESESLEVPSGPDSAENPPPLPS